MPAHIKQPDGTCSCGGDGSWCVQEPTAVRNYEDVPAIFVACTTCGAGRCHHPDDLPSAGLACLTCHICGRILTLNVSEVPQTQSPASTTCSPDGSAYAYWVAPGKSGRTIAPRAKPSTSVPPEAPASPFPHIDAVRTQLTQLIDYARSVGIDVDAKDATGYSFAEKVQDDLTNLLEQERAKLAPNLFR